MENPINENAPLTQTGHFKNNVYSDEIQNNYKANPTNNQLIGASPAKLAGIYQSLDDANKAQFNRLVLHPDEIPPADAANSNGWQAIDLAEIYKPQPPIQYLAAGLLELPSLNIFYGAPGTLKSFLLQDLAICIAAGKPWLQQAPWQTGGYVFPTNKAAIMWVDFDMGKRRTVERFAALCRHYETPSDAGVTVYSMANPPLDASNPGHIAELAARIMATDSRLVVIDNLGTISGGAEENSSAMIAIMFNLRWLADETGAAVVLIHHQRKSNGMGGRAGDSLRGHSSIEAAIDLALQIEREPYAELINVQMTKSRGLEVLPFSAAVAFEANENDELISACFYSIAQMIPNQTGN